MTDKPIGGPYALGDRPPLHLCGWAGPELARVAYAALHRFFATYRDWRERFAGDVDAPPSDRIWEYTKRVNGGSHLSTWYQEDGDCVSMGCVNAVDYRSAYEIAGRGEEEKFRRGFPPFTYGVSRTAPDLGNNRLGREAGSLGSWGAEALRRYGCLFVDDAGTPAYTGKIAKSWGTSGPPAEARELAKDNPMRSTVALSTVEQVRHELINRRPVTIASNQGWAMQPIEWHGLHVFKPEGSFGHQTVLLDWIDDFGGLAYRLNSWGADAHGTPLNGEPPGGAWWRAADLEAELRQRGGCELYACSMFEGEKSGPNYSILEPGKDVA